MSWTVDPNVQSFLGALGAFSALYLFLSPLNTFRRILGNKNTENFSVFPYISSFLNCALWVIYAAPFITPDRFSPLFTNIIGLVFHSTYITLFIKFAKNETHKNAILMLGGTLSFLLFIILLLFLLPPPSRSGSVGIFAVVFTVIMFGSPLSSIGLVFKTQSVEFMPFYLSLGTFVCSTMWLLYGIYVMDYYVLLPNLLGSILGIFQLTVYAYISSKSKYQKNGEKQIDEKKSFFEGVELQNS